MQAVLPPEVCSCRCGCAGRLEAERRKVRGVLVTVMERLATEERGHGAARRRAEDEAARVMEKLAVLQRSLVTEQARVRSLLNSKDNIIRYSITLHETVRRSIRLFVEFIFDSLLER